MLQPKKVKHRKMFKGRLRGKALRGNTLAFGAFGLQAISSGYITAR
jgi:large subunit ribosomal protein L16